MIICLNLISSSFSSRIMRAFGSSLTIALHTIVWYLNYYTLCCGKSNCMSYKNLYDSLKGNRISLNVCEIKLIRRLVRFLEYSSTRCI